MNQGSQAWLQERAGCATASRFKDILARIKSGEASSRKTYRLQLVTERLTGLPIPSFENDAMRHGTATEPFARAAYEAERTVMVDETGFLKHPTIPFVGCSPDGLIDPSGGVEIKCPHNSMVHVETLESGMPPEHRAQVQGAMWVTGRAWWDFVSFDPRLPAHLQLYVERINRDEAYIATLTTEVTHFLNEVDAMVKRLTERPSLADQLRASLKAVA